MKFIGVDLGWQSGPSGLCSLVLSDKSLVLEKLERKATLVEVLAWLDDTASSGTSAIVAVDAPILIPNETGMRVPDRLAHKYFGIAKRGCIRSLLWHFAL